MGSGLLEWSNAIRFTMANDPGREIFKDQINNHGFLFLEDYLVNILQGVKQDPMIELVKTPGRKRPLHKKPNPAMKLNRGFASCGFNDQHSPVDNLPTITEHPSLNPESLVDDGAADQSTADSTPLLAGLGVPSKSEPKDLSVIVEDDEIIEVLPKDHSPSTRASTRGHIPEEQSAPQTHSFSGTGGAQEVEASLSSYPTSWTALPSTVTNSPSEPHAPDVPGLLTTTETAPHSAISPKNEISTVPMSLSSQDPVDSVRNLDPLLVPDDGVDTKFGPMLYPALPAPLPLRKSMRAPRDPSVNLTASNAATPGATLGGKRTSWLKKAREVKALESTTKGPTTSVVPLPSSSISLKRKSESMDQDDAVAGVEEDERHFKSTKSAEGATASSSTRIMKSPSAAQPRIQNDVRMSPQLLSTPQAPIEQEGMLDRLKKTVEGIGARVGKSTGKPLSAGAVAVALAEAKAAAEARVAERDIKKGERFKKTGTDMNVAASIPSANTEHVLSDDSQRRLSISDLFPPNDGSAKMKNRNGENAFEWPLLPTLQGAQINAQRESITTTPPDSPRLPNTALPSEPVFVKPPPVFIPPAGPLSTKSDAPVPGSQKTSTSPISLRLQENLSHKLAFGTQSTWFPPASDTGSSRFSFQPLLQGDDTDTWSTGEKQPNGSHWIFCGPAKEDDITTSTVPSQPEDSGSGLAAQLFPENAMASNLSNAIVSTVDMDMDDDSHARSLPEALTVGLSEHDDIMSSESQTSLASSQSQTGFIGSATKLISSALGMSKKGKPEVKKVLQMAALAAKKQQEENDKKAARLKEMENRRQLAIQRKIEDEKTKAQEQERKVKEESERRKRDREETTDKRSLKPTKKEDESTKKRKVIMAEAEKKEIKKVPSKSVLKPAVKPPMALSSSTAFNTSTATVSTLLPVQEMKPLKQTTDLDKGKSKVPSSKRPPGVEEDFTKPSQLVQIQMAARAKAQLQAARQESELIQSESIELPDINSEYSDSEDEDRPRTFDPPGWAQSPELREALHLQSTINPDDVFGAIQPLKMEEIFKTRTSRFRARTSSANWTGADCLTLEEEREYARRMGFK